MVPAPSAFSLAAARLGWSLPETALVSLHGRTLDLVRPHLQPGARILALTSDGEGPAALARLLAETGFGASRLTILEALGGPRERIRTIDRGWNSISARLTRSTLRRSKLSQRPMRASSPRTPGLSDDTVRARRPDHQARDSRRDDFLARTAARRVVVGRRSRLRLGRDRMDAGRSVDARDRHRTTRRSRGAHPPQRRRLRRAEP